MFSLISVTLSLSMIGSGLANAAPSEVLVRTNNNRTPSQAMSFICPPSQDNWGDGFLFSDWRGVQRGNLGQAGRWVQTNNPTILSSKPQASLAIATIKRH